MGAMATGRLVDHCWLSNPRRQLGGWCVNRSKAKGTSWESAIVDFLSDRQWPNVERRALTGSNDRGDIAGIPRCVIEAKNAARFDLAGWVAEATKERNNAQALFAAVWAKRRGKASPKDGYVIMTGEDFVTLLAMALPALNGDHRGQ